MGRILLVEDSIEFQKIVLRTLPGHEVACVGTTDEAMEKLSSAPFDLILLDIGLPKKNGYFLLSEIQANPDLCNIPVLCLTGKTEVTDKVTAFSLGADDYIVKPFDPLELKARIDAKILKTKRDANTNSVRSLSGITIDHNRHRVTIEGADGNNEEVLITQTEFKLLSCLTKSPDRVFTRDQLLVQAWGEDAEVLDRSVDVHLCALRKKLGSLGKSIRAVPGVGYKFTPAAALPKAKKAA